MCLNCCFVIKKSEQKPNNRRNPSLHSKIRRHLLLLPIPTNQPPLKTCSLLQHQPPSPILPLPSLLETAPSNPKPFPPKSLSPIFIPSK